MKNDLAGGTLPCGRFGANAAWWRLSVLVHNLLQFLKVAALPASWAALRPKALRMRLFDLPGRLVTHGRTLILKVSQALPTASVLAQARQALVALLAPS